MKLRGVALIALAGLLTGACGGAGGSGPSGGGGKGLVKVTAGITGYDSYLVMLPFHIAVEKGYFKDAGIELDPSTTGGGGATIRTVTTGGLDMAVGGADAGITAAEKKQGITIVAPYWTTADIAWAVPEDSPIKTIQDLAGKSVGFSSTGGAVHFLLQNSVKAAGVKDVKLVQTGSDGNTWAALKSGQIDAAWSLEPLLTQHVINDHARVVFYGVEYVPHFMQDLILFNSDYVKAHPDVVRGFMTAIIKGMDLLREHPEEAAAIGASYMKLDKSVVLRAINNVPHKETGLTFKVDPQAFKTFEKSMIEAGEIPGPIQDWDEIFDQSFLPQEDRATIPVG